MTNFLRDSGPRRIIGSRENPARRFYAILGILIIVSFLFFGRHVLSAQFVAFAEPLWFFEKKIESILSPLTSVWANSVELKAQNAQLIQEANEKNLELRQLLRVIDDYKKIGDLYSERERFDRSARDEGSLALVLSRPPVSPYDTLVIKIDESSNIKEGDFVYAPGGILLGETREVSGTRAKVLLYSSPGEMRSGFLSGVGAVELEGRGGGNFETQLPKETRITPSASITYEGGSTILARVGTTTQTEGDSFQRVFAQLPINIQSLEWLRIISRD